jgi:hypothetical protein
MRPINAVPLKRVIPCALTTINTTRGSLCSIRRRRVEAPRTFWPDAESERNR